MLKQASERFCLFTAKKSMAAAKKKGNRYENKIRKDLESDGFGAARNTQYDQNQKDAADVFVSPGRSQPLECNSGRLRPALHIECKDQKAWPWSTWLSAYDQAKAAKGASGCDGVAIVVAHAYRTKDDYVLLHWSDFRRIFKDAYG